MEEPHPNPLRVVLNYFEVLVFEVLVFEVLVFEVLVFVILVFVVLVFKILVFRGLSFRGLSFRGLSWISISFLSQKVHTVSVLGLKVPLHISHIYSLFKVGYPFTYVTVIKCKNGGHPSIVWPFKTYFCRFLRTRFHGFTRGGGGRRLDS